MASFRKFSYARHTHDSYALGTVEEGAMEFWHGGAQHTARSGQVIVINPGEVHDGHTGCGAGCRYRMLYVERPTIEDLIGADSQRIRDTFALQGPVLSDGRLARGLRALHAVLDGEDATILEQQARIAQLLFTLFSVHGKPPIRVLNVAREERVVCRAKHYMQERLGEKVRLGELADAVGLSPCYFLRTFRHSMGMPPHAYLNQMRLDHARTLLRAGEPPAQVAAALGFVDQSHLNRRFKSAFGVTPGQYRG